MSSSYAQAITVPVRGGIHDRFNRIVLDWPTPVKYTMDQNDGVVTIQFDHPATLNLAQFRAAQPPYIQDLASNDTASGLELRFRIPEKSRVQAFWSGNSVAFDVLLMDKGKPTFAPKDPAAAEHTPPDQAADVPADKPVDEPAPAVEKLVEPPKKDDKTSGPQQSQVLPPESAPLPKPPAPTPRDMTPATLAEDLAKDAAEPATAPAPDVAPAPVSTEPTVIHIRPLAKISTAVFVCAGRLWIVLDQAPDGVAPQIEGALQASLKNYTRQVSTKAVAFVFSLPDSITAQDIAVKLDTLNWDIYLQPAQKTADMAPAAASDFDLGIDDKGLTLLTGQNATVFPFTDDAVGDKIWVIPVRSPLMKVARQQQNAAIMLSPTVLGGLLIPQQEHLNVVAQDNQILIQMPEGALPLSSAQDREEAEDRKPQQNILFMLKTAPFPPEIKDFETQRQYLELNMARQTDETDKAIQALDLARLYLQQGYGLEAQGALSLAQGYVPNLAQTPSFAALQGMSYALAGKVQPAMDVFAQPNIQQNDLTAFWQAYTYAQDKNWEKAFIGFRTHDSYFNTYGPALAAKLSLAAAESAVETNNIADAQKFLRAIPSSASLDSGQKAARDFLQASIWQAGDDDQKDKASALLTNLAQGIDRYYRVKADIALMDVKLEKDDIKIKDAINELEKLRFAWRGDRQEIMVLQRLGQYYLKDQNPLQAMTIWREGLSLAKNETDKASLQKTLQDEFNHLFVEGNNKGMLPLQSLSLYQRFKELMPPGEQGAKAAMLLADQLLQVDLVDEADAMLQEQLSKQPATDQTVALGTKLATIRLMARNAAGALKALDDSEQQTMLDDVKTKRILLRARVLADLQKTDDALALLNKPTIPEGLSLRADIFWRLNRWADASHDLQDLIDNTTPKTAQNKQYTALILRLTIVKALQNDQAGLDQLNAQYGDIMNQAGQNKVFQIMTTALDSNSTLSDLQTLKSQVADTELFEGFLKGF